MARAYCPQCDARITMDSPREGRRITCRGCGAELEVVSVDPFAVHFGDWRDERWFEDRRQRGELDSDWRDEQASSESYEGTALHRAAYDDHDLTDL